MNKSECKTGTRKFYWNLYFAIQLQIPESLNGIKQKVDINVNDNVNVIRIHVGLIITCIFSVTVSKSNLF